MRLHYFLLDTLGDLSSGYAILVTPPENIGLSFYKMANGERVDHEYPSDARIYMSEQQPGIKVPSIIGNTLGYLVVSSPVKAVIEALCKDVEIEYLPFTLYNHKKRPHPGDFFIINPIGVRDYLDLDASKIEYLDEPGDYYHGSVVGVDEFVLDARKLERAPALFRVREEPHRYFIDERLAEALRARGFSNVVLTEVERTHTEGAA